MTAAKKNSNPVGPPTVSHYSTTDSGSDVPRALIVIDGNEFTPISLSISNNAHGVLDTADCVLPISSNPDLSTLFKSRQEDGAVLGSVYIGFPGISSLVNVSAHQLQRRFFGLIDTIEPNFGKDEVRISFRSLGALLELQKHTNTSIGETTTAFVTMAAKLSGLTPKIILAKDQFPATLQDVFSRDFSVGIQSQRLWDTITACADFDDVDTYVIDSTLYYVRADAFARKVINLKYGHDIKSFDGKHSPQFNKNIHVEVRTSNPRIRQSHTTRVSSNSDGTPSVSESTRVVTSETIFGTNASVSNAQSYDPLTGKSSTSTSSGTQSGGGYNTGVASIPKATSGERYIYYRYGMKPETANQLVKTIFNQLSRSEYSATFTIIPDTKNFHDITIESKFQVNNVPYQGWNTSQSHPYYFPRRMTTRFDGPISGSSQGLEIEIEAINHRPPVLS